jgi:hypothetical protein
LTTIGVLRIWRTKSSALATARSPVSRPLMISTSIILCTGEKKWMPMNCSGDREALASSLIGRVEVLVAKIASSGRCCSARRVVSALTPGSSNTASTTRSQPSSAA